MKDSSITVIKDSSTSYCISIYYLVIQVLTLMHSNNSTLMNV